MTKGGKYFKRFFFLEFLDRLPCFVDLLKHKGSVCNFKLRMNQTTFSFYLQIHLKNGTNQLILKWRMVKDKARIRVSSYNFFAYKFIPINVWDPFGFLMYCSDYMKPTTQMLAYHVGGEGCGANHINLDLIPYELPSVVRATVMLA